MPTPNSIPVPALTDEALTKMMELADGDLEGIALRMVAIRRRNAAASAKASQPAVSISGSPDDLAKFIDDFRKPMTAEEQKNWAQGADLDLISFQESLDAGDLNDAVCAAFRMARRLHFQVFGSMNLDPDPAKWPDHAKKQFQYKGK